jgi:hypothetical protein
MHRSFYYNGSSMNGTFCPGDYLLASPCDAHLLRIGDVIMFRIGDAPRRHFVHRIRQVCEGPVLLTQGDASPFPDCDPVQPDAVIGKVIACERGGRSLRVANGFAGRLHVHKLRIKHGFKRILSRSIHAILPRCRRLLRTCLPKTHRVVVQTPSGSIHKYVVNRRRVVATWIQASDHWEFVTPWQYVLKDSG